MILLENHFNYPKLKRIDTETGRRYVTPSGEHLPSVTTILSATKSKKDKEVLENWRKRIGRDNAQRITTEAAGLGTIIHNQLEKYIRGEELKWGNNFIQLMAKKMVDRVIAEGLSRIDKVYGLECSLYHEGLYSGTADLVIGIGDEILIGDFKNTKKMKKREWIDDYLVQTVAYSRAHNLMFGTKIKKTKILMVARPTEINLEPEYKEFDLEGLEFSKYDDMWLSKLEQFYANK